MIAKNEVRPRMNPARRQAATEPIRNLAVAKASARKARRVREGFTYARQLLDFLGPALCRFAYAKLEQTSVEINLQPQLERFN